MDPETQLLTLRTHLLSLGRTEGQLRDLRDKASDVSTTSALTTTTTTTTEYSIVEVLQLWQRIFQETFQQYHRLSTRLVHSQDSASALKLWQQYLHHVQSFLSSAIPEDYASLTEHRHLCEVHQNLLTSQQQVLASKTDEEEAAATSSQRHHHSIDPVVRDEYNALSRLHDETLGRIVDRHGEIEKRLSAWDRYRTDQANLLAWLHDKEKERTRMQLRYIHLKRVPKLCQRIERLLEQIPQGEDDAASLRHQQSAFLSFCADETLATSVRMEHASVTQRIANLRAAMETWRDFLVKIQQLSETYDGNVRLIQRNFHEVQAIVTTVANELPTTSAAVQERLGKLRAERVRLNQLTPELESINVIQEELKECISPFDMKTIRQMVWILWQQQADLDQQLSTVINQIEERISLNSIFMAKYERLMQWMDDIEKRLDTDASSMLRDPEDLIRRLEKDLNSEMELREREREWLLSSGQELLSFYSNPRDNEHRQEVQQKLDAIVDRWERLKTLCKSRSNKIADLKSTIYRLEERIAKIRSWMYTMEVDMSVPVQFESVATSVIKEKLSDHDRLQRAIEQQSSEVGEVLNLCEMLLSDVDTWKTHFNTTALTAAVEQLERRWRSLCSSSAERKRRILSNWTLLQEVHKLTGEHEDWLARQEAGLAELANGINELTKEQGQQRIHTLEGRINEIEMRASDLKILEHTYSKLVRANGLEPENVRHLTADTRSMLVRWRALVPKALDIIGQLNMDTKIYREFINSHGRAVVTLTHIDVELTKIQSDLTPVGADAQERRIAELEQELKLCEADLANADQLGLVLMQRSEAADDIAPIQQLIDEYQMLWKDINERLALMKRSSTVTTSSTKRNSGVDESVQVQTLRFETDSAVQVNTLPGLNRMTSITPKDAYLYELEAAVKECRSNLEQLERAVNDPTKKSGSQVVSKLLSNSQSSVELMNHLSTLLITECFCTNEEAQVGDVAELCARYETLVALWKARERQQQDIR